MKSSLKWLMIGVTSMTLLPGCDQISGLLGGNFDGGRRSSSGFLEDSDKASDGAPPALNDMGMALLQLPSEEEMKLGKEVTSMKKSTVGASEDGLESWVYTKGAKYGRFLIAATSKPNTSGGDMIRRLDLGSSIKEFDYDPDKKGTQGAYIYVSDEMRGTVPNKYIDSEGFFSAPICGFVPGPDKTLIALGGSTYGGVAFVIDPYEEAAAFTPKQALFFPYASRLCRGVYSSRLQKLYAIDVTRTGAKNGQEGVFVADITLDGKATPASYYSVGKANSPNTLSVNNFQDIALYEDRLFLLSGNGRFDADWDNTLFAVPINDLGEPLFNELKYYQTNNPVYMTPACGIGDANISSIAVVKTKTGPVLLSTGTDATFAWDISGDDLKKVDLNEKRPGVQGMTLEEMGRGGVALAPTPDGKHWIQLTHCRSEKTNIQIDSTYTVKAFSLPVISADTLKPADPIDAGYIGVLKSLKSAKYYPSFSMTFADFAVGPKHIAIVGASGSNISGLGAGGDVNIIDRGKGTSLSFTKPADMKHAHELNYGFKLAKDDPDFKDTQQHSHTVIWLP